MPQERLWNRNYCKVMATNFMLFFAFSCFPRFSASKIKLS